MAYARGRSGAACLIMLWRSRSWENISGMNHRRLLSEWSSKKQRSSLVIDALCDGVKVDNAAVAYVYCDYTIQKEQSARSVLGAVLRQVIRALAQVPDEVREAFEHAKRQADGCGPLLTRSRRCSSCRCRIWRRDLSASTP